MFLLFTLKLRFDFGGLIGMKKATIVTTYAVVFYVVLIKVFMK